MMMTSYVDISYTNSRGVTMTSLLTSYISNEDYNISSLTFHIGIADHTYTQELMRLFQ